MTCNLSSDDFDLPLIDDSFTYSGSLVVICNRRRKGALNRQLKFMTPTMIQLVIVLHLLLLAMWLFPVMIMVVGMVINR